MDFEGAGGHFFHLELPYDHGHYTIVISGIQLA
jgi:hypothetical protein